MEVKLEKKEILRYLGYRRKQELTPEMDQQIQQLMEEVKKVADPRYTFLIFPCQPDENEKNIQVIGTDLVLEGKAIYNHLKYAKNVALLAATLGIEVERQIRKYELTEMSKALILDACCVEYIEKICDLAECAIEQEVADEQLILNRRFSPGYGDLPIETQAKFLAVTDATKRVGINLTESFLMIPPKSVTAIIGLFDDEIVARPRRKRPACNDCSMNKICEYRR